MATRYLSVETLKAQTRDGVTVDDNLKESAIQAAETWIDNELHRQMIKASDTPSARVFVPAGSDLLHIYDCTSVTSVTENGVLLAAGTDYQLEPLNGLNDTGETVPYYRVLRHGRCWYTDNGKATVSIVATWGWAEIPPQVVEACKIIAQDILANRDTRFGLAGITEVAGIRMRENPVVAKMIEHYRFAYKSFGIA